MDEKLSNPYQPKTLLGKQIIELREEGKSMNEIATILGCSKSTVSYHCSSTTRLKASERGRRLRNEYPAEYKFISHMDKFIRRERGIGKKDSQD